MQVNTGDTSRSSALVVEEACVSGLYVIVIIRRTVLGRLLPSGYHIESKVKHIPSLHAKEAYLFVSELPHKRETSDLPYIPLDATEALPGNISRETILEHSLGLTPAHCYLPVKSVNTHLEFYFCNCHPGDTISRSPDMEISRVYDFTPWDYTYLYTLKAAA